MDQTIIIEGRKRRVWPADRKRQIVEESCDPDVTVCEVARRYDLDPAQLFAWRKKYLPSSEPPSAFLPVEMSDDPHVTEADDSTDRIEVVLTNGRHLFVPASVDPKHLERLVRVLDR